MASCSDCFPSVTVSARPDGAPTDPSQAQRSHRTAMGVAGCSALLPASLQQCSTNHEPAALRRRWTPLREAPAVRPRSAGRRRARCRDLGQYAGPVGLLGHVWTIGVRRPPAGSRVDLQHAVRGARRGHKGDAPPARRWKPARAGRSSGLRAGRWAALAAAQARGRSADQPTILVADDGRRKKRRRSLCCRCASGGGRRPAGVWRAVTGRRRCGTAH